jgi:hypothetical protein
MSWVTSSLILSIFIFNSFFSVFMVFSVSVWCLFRVHLSSFICFCVFSYSLFLLSWNFLNASCTYWLTMSSNISMKFEYLQDFFFQGFLVGFIGFLCSLSLFHWSLSLGTCFLHFALNPVLIYFCLENGFHPFVIFKSFHLVLFLSLVYI